MSSGGLEFISRTVQETHLWLKDVLARIGGTDQHRAYLVLRAVLHGLRDRLGPIAAAQLAAQLPMLLRGLFYEGWHPGDKPTKLRHKEAFLARVHAQLPAGLKLDTESAVRAVLAVLQARIDAGEIDKVKKILPEELRGLFAQSP